MALRAWLGLAGAIAAGLGAAASAEVPPESASAILLELNSFRVCGSVLYVAAHPDDENTRLIAYFARVRGFRTGYLSLTRGDGGQNLIGPELDEELGAIRTQELLAARRMDGGNQFFSRPVLRIFVTYARWSNAFVGQVGAERLDADGVGALEFRLQLLQPRQAARHQQQVVAARRELAGELRAQSAGSAGDDGDTVGGWHKRNPVGYHRSPAWQGCAAARVSDRKLTENILIQRIPGVENLKMRRYDLRSVLVPNRHGAAPGTGVHC